MSPVTLGTVRAPVAFEATGATSNPVDPPGTDTGMSLSELISGVADHEKTMTVFNAEAAVVSQLQEYFSDRNVRVESEETPSGKPGTFVTLSEDGNVLTAAGLDDLHRMLGDEPASLGLRDRPYQPILDHLDDTLFTSWETSQMVAASREIEDRAYRVGSGTLHAGFQYVSTMTNELPIYERLGSTDVDVHAYAFPDTEPPDSDEFSLHIERAAEIEQSWFVVYDGGPDPEDKCALLAEERDARTFFGFWTYDESTVDWLGEYLQSSYTDRRNG
ncbi:MAG: DICT domain-containing protein [Haloarculaceae archaeon]